MGNSKRDMQRLLQCLWFEVLFFFVPKEKLRSFFNFLHRFINYKLMICDIARCIDHSFMYTFNILIQKGQLAKLTLVSSSVRKRE